MRTFAIAVALALVAPLALATRASAQATPGDDLASPKLRIEWTAFKPLYDARGVVVIDVREAVSYESGHIPGARSIPWDQVGGRVAELKRLGKPIVLYCA